MPFLEQFALPSARAATVSTDETLLAAWRKRGKISQGALERFHKSSGESGTRDSAFLLSRRLLRGHMIDRYGLKQRERGERLYS